MDINAENGAAGSLKVSTNVIVSIADKAASEVEGVAANSVNKFAVLADAPITSKFVSPIKVKINGDSAVIDIAIVTEQGYRAFEVAKAVQEHVKSSVQNMTGIAVSKVNVKIVSVKTK
ncbi:MAG: Asp23/Gls24 family envelope stress response protein [Ruminiclostridium sp.]|nr:Asp23/Gls24 family envelope stress response protein [Ruminiclostridium sp.]